MIHQRVSFFMAKWNEFRGGSQAVWEVSTMDTSSLVDGSMVGIFVIPLRGWIWGRYIEVEAKITPIKTVYFLWLKLSDGK